MSFRMHRISRLSDHHVGLPLGFGSRTHLLLDIEDEDFPSILGERFCRYESPATLRRLRAVGRN